MRTDDLATLTVPVSYAMLLMEAAEAHGVAGETLLAAADLAPALVEDPGGRLPALRVGLMLDRAIALTGEPALGYEMALSSSLTSHGLLGFGMLTSTTVREAIRLGIEFIRLRVPVLRAELREEGDVAVVSIAETMPLFHLRQVLFDTVLVKLARIGASLTDGLGTYDDVELWFDYAEPEYYARMKDRLPRMGFEMGSNEARFDASILDRRPATADPLNARMIEEQCRRELEQLGLAGDVVEQVRAILERTEDGYPSLSEVAERLHTSSRTLKRRLQDQGTSFHQLLDATRRAKAIRLLTSTNLAVEQVARQLGYADTSNFRRAFQAWTNTSPRTFRERHRAAP